MRVCVGPLLLAVGWWEVGNIEAEIAVIDNVHIQNHSLASHCSFMTVYHDINGVSTALWVRALHNC